MPADPDRPRPDTAGPVLAAIAARQSAGPRHLGPPGPTAADLGLVAGAAAAAIDHGRLGPLRLLVIPDVRRGALADIFAAAVPDPTPEAVAEARDRALAGAVLLACIARIVPDHPAIPVHEQWIAVGAALQNALLAVAALGFGAKMVSGRRVGHPALRAGFALPETEHLVGFVAIGTPMAEPRPARRRAADEVLGIWPGP